VAGEIEFDWFNENRHHLAVHKVAPEEFEQLLLNDPLDIESQVSGDEERYRSVGVTDSGKILSISCQRFG